MKLKKETSQLDSVGYEQSVLKLKETERLLADAQDRLEKIQQMELLVTGIEAAKYYASERAAQEVQGSKRNLQELIKRAEIQTLQKRSEIPKPQQVPQSLINELNVISKKH